MKRLGLHPHRNHEPLISFLEACDELGVPPEVLRGRFNRKDAPKPVIVNHAKTTTSWYDREMLTAWWRMVDPLRGMQK